MMGKAGRIARRSFLIGSAAILGGVAFGYYMYRREGRNPLLDGLGEGEAAITPYVRITADGVTLITPRADKGQGAYHVQAALIAEELDVDLDKVSVDPGPPSPVYYNTAMADEAAPFPSYDGSFLAETVRDVMDAPIKFIGLQITGGSTTVPDGWDKLRVAGAVARETLKKAASEISGINTVALETESGAVVLPDGTRMRYEELAAKAAQIEPVGEVKLREPGEWRYIGKEMQRIDIPAKSTGTQDYGIDFFTEGMVYAAVRLNPWKGGGVISFDDGAAKAMRGVETVFGMPEGVGVIADNSWRAFQAVDAIEVEWGEGGHAAEQADHWAALEAAFTGEAQDSQPRDEGDVDALGAAAVEAEYRAPYLAHAPLEPLNATVLFQDGRVDVWTGTQVPRFAQAHVAEATGEPVENVHIHVLPMGGSFGHRLEDEVVIMAARCAVAAKGKPVKLTFTREQDMAQEFLRPASMAKARGWVAEGKVHGLDIGLAAPSIMASWMAERMGFPAAGPDSSTPKGAADQPWAIPDYRVTAYRAQNMAPVSSWRSVGASINGFFHEGFFDEVIHAAGADPLEERLRLCLDPVTRAVLEAVGEMSNWSGTTPAEGKGRGLAMTMSFGVACAEVIEVSAGEDGITLDKVWAVADVGRIIDPVNFEAQLSGGVVFGLSHAIHGEMTFAGGALEQLNYDSYPSLRIGQCPEIEVRGLETGPKIRGIGEPGVPPAAPALANAIFAATGTRLREMPFAKFVDFA